MKQELYILISLFLLLPTAYAVEFDTTISAEDQATFDEILEPIMKIYTFVKYAATIIAALFLLFSGITFIVSASDQGKRESAKMMASYTVIGLVVIWVAPLAVNYLAV